METPHCPFDRIRYQSRELLIGEFTCPQQAPQFADTGPIENHLLVVPNRPVLIHRGRRDAVVADNTRVMFYNRGFTYRRETLNHFGDHCFWIAFDEQALAETLERPPHQPFSNACGPLNRTAYLLVQNLFHSLARGNPDEVAVEEIAWGILDRCLQDETSGQPPQRRQRETVRRAQTYLASHYHQPVSLQMVADAAACSPFHLSRLFHRLTGTRVHEYLTRLRLRAGVNRLLHEGQAVTTVAMDLGFSSPSHFSNRFRQEFGFPPRRLRHQLSDPSDTL